MQIINFIPLQYATSSKFVPKIASASSDKKIINITDFVQQN